MKTTFILLFNSLCIINFIHGFESNGYQFGLRSGDFRYLTNGGPHLPEAIPEPASNAPRVSWDDEVVSGTEERKFELKTPEDANGNFKYLPADRFCICVDRLRCSRKTYLSAQSGYCGNERICCEKEYIIQDEPCKCIPYQNCNTNHQHLQFQLCYKQDEICCRPEDMKKRAQSGKHSKEINKTRGNIMPAIRWQKRMSREADISKMTSSDHTEPKPKQIRYVKRMHHKIIRGTRTLRSMSNYEHMWDPDRYENKNDYF